MNEFKLQPTTLETYRENLKSIHLRLALFSDDPSKTPPDMVYSMLNNQMITEKETTFFTNEDMLELLYRLENWYTQQGFQFPDMNYLETERAKYR